MMINKSILACLLLAITSTLLSGCGARLVRGESPFVNIQGISTDGAAVELRLRVRNVNDVAIEVSALRFTLNLEATELASHDAAMAASVIASGTETLRFELDASEAGLALLRSLETGEVPNLAYDISGSISSAGEDPLVFSGAGRIYPVPGRPGRFR